MTPEEIEALSPNPSNFARGKKLANQAKWTLLAYKEDIIWGLCKGSGSNPYKVQVDLGNIAYKCSCPSRQFPCKHSLALLLLHAQNKQAFIEQEPDDWVQEWVDKRKKAQTQKVKKSESTEEDLVKKELHKEKTANKRKEQMRLGIIELKHWLDDVMRLGLAELKKEPYSYFVEKGARLQDAKLPVLRNVVIELHSKLQQQRWQIASLEALSWLYTVANAYEHIEEFSEDFQTDLRTVVGVNTKKEEVLQNGKVISDNWLVLGKRKEDSPTDTNLKIQRTWLLGEQTQKFALLLDFSYRGAAFEYYLIPNTAFEGELVYYPGTYPLRAIVKTKKQKLDSISGIKAATDFSDFSKKYAEALAVNPFLLQFPFLVNQLCFNAKMEVFDKEKRPIPLSGSFKNNYELLALSGGAPIALFGEWMGEKLVPIAALIESKVYPL